MYNIYKELQCQGLYLPFRYMDLPWSVKLCWPNMKSFLMANRSFKDSWSFFFFNTLNFYFYFILLYNTVLVLPYIDTNPPRVYMRSQTWTPLPPPSPQHPSGLSLCTSPKHAVSCIGHRLVIRFLHDSIHVSMPFSQIIPPSPSTESKSLLYTSVSFCFLVFFFAVLHTGSSLPSF